MNTKKTDASDERTKLALDDKPDDTGTTQETALGSDRRFYSITVLNRAIDILEAFTPERSSMNLTEIGRLTGLPKTTAFRILSSLLHRGFIELNPETGKYSLGFVFLRMAETRRKQNNFHDVAARAMRAIRDAIGETVVLSVRVGDNRVHIDTIETHQQLKRTATLGVQVPLYIGASGKVLLSGMDDSEITDFFRRTDLVAVQDTTITDQRILWREIMSIRMLGYAESRGELIQGGGALAAPLRDYTGKTIAALDILTPWERYSDQHRDLCIEVLLEKTAEASKALGYMH